MQVGVEGGVVEIWVWGCEDVELCVGCVGVVVWVVFFDGWVCVVLGLWWFWVGEGL